MIKQQVHSNTFASLPEYGQSIPSGDIQVYLWMLRCCVQLYCVSFNCLSLHVSAHMAIFKCVGYFYFHMPEGRNM
jgi:hypothetical protein